MLRLTGKTREVLSKASMGLEDRKRVVFLSPCPEVVVHILHIHLFKERGRGKNRKNRRRRFGFKTSLIAEVLVLTHPFPSTSHS